MDIVEQLRKSANTVYSQDGYTFRLGLQNEAADEIERLRNKVRWLEMCETTVVKQDNEIERLREELDRQIAWKDYAINSGLVLADAVIHARQNGYVLPAWLHNAAINPLDLFLEEKKRRAALKEGE
jgi:hypothetical protein